MKVILLLIAAALVVSCTDKKGATSTLEKSGFKPISVGGYGFFYGSKSDVYKTKFKAISVSGDTVTGCVTGGLLGNTIRMD